MARNLADGNYRFFGDEGAMRSFIRAAQFMLQSQLKVFPKIDEADVELDAGGDRLPAIVYRRAETKTCRTIGTILAVSGMSVHGYRDIRFATICRAMAACGFIVVSPSYRDIGEFEINGRTVGSIASTIRTIAGDPGLCPRGMVSLFSPSFSAAMCIIAASRPGTADIVGSICSVGTFGSVETAVEFLLERQDNDEYGRMIVLKNFLRLSIGANGSLEKAFEICYRDNGFHREHPELPAYLENLPAEERDVFQRLRNEPSFRLYHWKRILDRSGEMRELIAELSVVRKLDGLRAPVSLIHGADDNVIPPSESAMIHRELRRLNVPTILELTPLISHGDASLSLAMLPAIIRLTLAFAFFFRHAGKAADTP
ncbi:MAG: alpha/beta hydrolase [Spirochaetes bacterium]|jgi:acetyl esterase/lipase|nr:alpha/beta hydrolase [Spirochaetota bacterium]